MIHQPLKAANQGAAHASAAGRSLRDREIDLHLHSTFSDGVKTPAELCRMARKAGVGTLALTDHDTAAGYPDMAKAAQEEGLVLLPGVEVSTGESGNVHVLGYGKRILCDEMSAFLCSVASDRVSRAKMIMEQLDKEGLVIPSERRAELLQNPGVGRPHIARELISLGAVNTVKQAFDRYLARGQCAYVPRQLPSTGQTIQTMRRLGVVPVLAHPQPMELDWPALSAIVSELKSLGLMGLEAYHSSVNSRAARQLDALARRNGLFVTGGSDYHGDPASTVQIGRLPSGWQQRDADLSALMEAIHKGA